MAALEELAAGRTRFFALRPQPSSSTSIRATAATPIKFGCSRSSPAGDDPSERVRSLMRAAEISELGTEDIDAAFAFHGPRASRGRRPRRLRDGCSATTSATPRPPGSSRSRSRRSGRSPGAPRRRLADPGAHAGRERGSGAPRGLGSRQGAVPERARGAARPSRGARCAAVARRGFGRDA